MTGHIVILGSLDTKGLEVAFLRDTVLEQGGAPLVVDTGVLGEATIPAQVSRYQVAAAAGTTIRALIERGDKAHALVTMANGAARILQDLYQEASLGGVLSIGGSRGTALSTRVMQALPVGLPKLMVSTMASGHNPFGPYVGTKDVTIMHSVADVQGINAVTRPIFVNAAAAITAMGRVGAPVRSARRGTGGERRVLAASMLGVSTSLVGQIQELMVHDAEVIAFHAVGTGGQSMEELIDDGVVDGVFDVTPGELAALVVGGPFSAGPERMRAAGRLGVPRSSPRVVSTLSSKAVWTSCRTATGTARSWSTRPPSAWCALQQKRWPKLRASSLPAWPNRPGQRRPSCRCGRLVGLPGKDSPCTTPSRTGPLSIRSRHTRRATSGLSNWTPT